MEMEERGMYVYVWKWMERRECEVDVWIYICKVWFEKVHCLTR